MGKVKIGNFKGPQGERGPQGPAGPQGPEGPQGPMGAVDANTQIVFTQAASRENIASGEKLNIILGKIRKWFADIKGAAFQDVSNTLTTTEAGKVLDARQGKVLDGKVTEKVDKTDVVNGLTETAAGKVLDARQGKALDEKIDNLSKEVSDLNSKLGENYIVEEGSNSNGKYRKWSDGTLEMWHSGNATCAIGTVADSVYMSSEFTFTFPIASKTACYPVLSIIAQGAIWGSPSSSGNSYRTSFKYHLMAATIWNLASFSYSYYARGTWK